MLILTCVNKLRDNRGKVLRYELVEPNGTMHLLNPGELKFYIKSGEYMVTNLHLTSNNRLVDIKYKINSQKV